MCVIRSWLVCFWLFFPFLCPSANRWRCSLLILSFLKSYFKHMLLSLFTKERSEWFAQVADVKRATMSDSLRPLMTKEWRERFTLFHEWIALSLIKNERISRKTDEQILLLRYIIHVTNFLFSMYLHQFIMEYSICNVTRIILYRYVHCKLL